MKNRSILMAIVAGIVFNFGVTHAGDGAHGGSTPVEKRATIKMMEESIANVKMAALYVLRFMRYQARFETPHSDGLRGLQKIFDPSKPDYVTALNQANIVVKSDKPCEVDGVNKEGSANPETQTICLSPFEIEKRHWTKRQIDQKILSLFLHEFSHLRGANESEALGVQGRAEWNSGHIEFYDLAVHVTNLQIEITWVSQALLTLAHPGDSPTPAETCGYIHRAIDNVRLIVETNQDKPADKFGAFIFDEETSARLRAVYYMLENSFTACLNTSTSIWAQKMLALANKQVSVLDYTTIAAQAGDRAGGPTPPSGDWGIAAFSNTLNSIQMRVVAPNDFIVAQEQLAQAGVLLGEINSLAQRLPVYQSQGLDRLGFNR